MSEQEMKQEIDKWRETNGFLHESNRQLNLKVFVQSQQISQAKENVELLLEHHPRCDCMDATGLLKETLGYLMEPNGESKVNQQILELKDQILRDRKEIGELRSQLLELTDVGDAERLLRQWLKIEKLEKQIETQSTLLLEFKEILRKTISWADSVANKVAQEYRPLNYTYLNLARDFYNGMEQTEKNRIAL